MNVTDDLPTNNLEVINFAAKLAKKSAKNTQSKSIKNKSTSKESNVSDEVKKEKSLKSQSESILSTDTKSKFTSSLALSFVFAVSISVGILFWQEDLSLSEKECEIRFCNLNYQLCHSKGDHH